MTYLNVIDNINLDEKTIALLSEIDYEVNRIIEVFNNNVNFNSNSLMKPILKSDMDFSFAIEGYDKNVRKYIIDYLETNNLILNFHEDILKNDYKLSKPILFSLYSNLMSYSGSNYTFTSFRNKNVYIGIPGEEPIFTPPGFEEVNPFVNDIIHFFNNNNNFHPFIKSSIIHYLMVRVHPFNDGNGRISRILQHATIWKDPKYRLDNNSKLPFIVLSKGFYKNIEDYFYYEGLLHNDILNNKNWNLWFQFNLKLIERYMYNLADYMDILTKTINLEKLKFSTSIKK